MFSCWREREKHSLIQIFKRFLDVNGKFKRVSLCVFVSERESNIFRVYNERREKCVCVCVWWVSRTEEKRPKEKVQIKELEPMLCVKLFLFSFTFFFLAFVYFVFGPSIGFVVCCFCCFYFCCCSLSSRLLSVQGRCEITLTSKIRVVKCWY